MNNYLTCGFGESWSSEAGQAGPCEVLIEQKTSGFQALKKQSKMIRSCKSLDLCFLEMRLFLSVVSLYCSSFKKLLLAIQVSFQNIFLRAGLGRYPARLSQYPPQLSKGIYRSTLVTWCLSHCYQELDEIASQFRSALYS